MQACIHSPITMCHMPMRQCAVCTPHMQACIYNPTHWHMNTSLLLCRHRPSWGTRQVASGMRAATSPLPKSRTLLPFPIPIFHSDFQNLLPKCHTSLLPFCNMIQFSNRSSICQVFIFQASLLASIAIPVNCLFKPPCGCPTRPGFFSRH
jgi:hypothetical protein